MDILNTIREEIKKQKLGCRDIADSTGLTTRYIYYLMQGKYKSISVENADKILKALKVTVKIGDHK